MTKSIPKQAKQKNEKIPREQVNELKGILFSFACIEKNEYFNLDMTCQSWASDLFAVLKQVSSLSINRIRSGEFSREGSTLRIHNHSKATLPPGVYLPVGVNPNLTLEDLWQIRISKSKGGIHGEFIDNVFYVMWFDPLHNLYPDSKYGGLKKIHPPKTCCMDRDEVIERKDKEIEQIKKERDEYKEYCENYTRPRSE